MRPPDVKRPGRAAAQPGRGNGSLGRRANSKFIAIKSGEGIARPFFVWIRAFDQLRLWSKFCDEQSALEAVSQLRKFGFDAHIDRLPQ